MIATEQAEELIEAMGGRGELRIAAEVPFANESRPVAGSAKQVGQVVRRGDEPLAAVARRPGVLDAYALLITASDQGCAGGAAEGAIGVALRKAHALGGETIDGGRADVFSAVTGEVGEAEVIGEDEDDVGGLGWRGRRRGSCEECPAVQG